METQIVLKLVYNDEMHRIPLEVRELSYERMKLFTKSLFPFLDECFHFLYKDEQEKNVNVSSEMELAEVVRLAYVTHKHLKLVVVKNTKPNSHTPCCPIPIRPLLNQLEKKLEECCKTFHAYGSWSCATLESLRPTNFDDVSIRKSEEIQGIQVRGWKQTQNNVEDNLKPQYVQTEQLNQSSILSEKPLQPTITQLNPLEKPQINIEEVIEFTELEDMDESLSDSQLSFEEMIHSDDDIVIIEKEESNSPYDEKLRKLVEMGFKDRHKNLDLLIRQNGSMVGTVKELTTMKKKNKNKNKNICKLM